MGRDELEILPKSRAEAIAAGSEWYYSQCKHGHESRRRTRTRQCEECGRVIGRRSYAKHKDRYLTAESRDRARKWRLDNPERYADNIAKWHEKNPDVASVAKRRWKEKNPHQSRADCAKRYAAKRHRTPLWSDLVAIKEIYEQCPQGMHVDHIVPILGEFVSGLHVPENLQYLTPQENFAKSNSWES